jgi:hypothetical protein
MSTKVYSVADIVNGYVPPVPGGYITLIDLITRDITPGSWYKDLPHGAHLYVHGATQSLVIRQTEMAHAQIEELLKTIRSAKGDNGDFVMGAAIPQKNVTIGLSALGVCTLDNLIPFNQAYDVFPMAVLPVGGYNQQNEHRILAQLEKPVTLKKEDQLPLEAALDLLCLQVDIAPILDKDALREINLSPGTLTQVPTVNNVKLKDALKLFCDQHNLAWIVKNEMLVITSKKRVKGDLVLRTYSAADLINNSARSDTPNYGRLLDIITNVIEPESWREDPVGGASITMHYSTKSLVIRQTEHAHAQIEGLLKTLREINAKPSVAREPENVKTWTDVYTR